jgi:hypothetical protein
LFPGEYSVSVEADLGSRFGTLEPVRCAAGDRDVTLELAVVRGSVAGRVLSPEQRGADAGVSAIALDGRSAMARRNDLDGSFRFDGLRAGAWMLRTDDGRGSAAMTRVEVLPGAELRGVDLRLERGAELVLHHAPSREATRFEVLRDGEVVFEDPIASGGASGTARLSVVPGTWTVRFLAGDTETLRRTLELGAGEQHEVARR